MKIKSNGFVYTPRAYLLGAFAIILIWKVCTYAAVTVTLAWDASPTTDIDGYRLQMVDANGNALRNTDVPADQLQASMADLVEGQSYSFICRAYRGTDVSDPSNLVSWTAPMPSPTPTPTPGPSATPTPQPLPLQPPGNVHVIGAESQKSPKAVTSGPTVSAPTATPAKKK